MPIDEIYNEFFAALLTSGCDVPVSIVVSGKSFDALASIRTSHRSRLGYHSLPPSTKTLQFHTTSGIVNIERTEQPTEVEKAVAAVHYEVDRLIRFTNAHNPGPYDKFK